VADNRRLLQVDPEQREELERWSQSRALLVGDVFRARLAVPRDFRRLPSDFIAALPW
jgi:hypothetical protein